MIKLKDITDEEIAFINQIIDNAIEWSAQISDDGCGSYTIACEICSTGAYYYQDFHHKLSCEVRNYEEYKLKR
jgi:hypothetical protein